MNRLLCDPSSVLPQDDDPSWLEHPRPSASVLWTDYCMHLPVSNRRIQHPCPSASVLWTDYCMHLPVSNRRIQHPCPSASVLWTDYCMHLPVSNRRIQHPCPSASVLWTDYCMHLPVSNRRIYHPSWLQHPWPSALSTCMWSVKLRSPCTLKQGEGKIQSQGFTDGVSLAKIDGNRCPGCRSVGLSCTNPAHCLWQTVSWQ